MIKNLFKTVFRNLMKYKTYSFINVAGLAIGLSCSILILLWIQNELSVDSFHENRDRMCQAYLKSTQGENTNLQSTVSPAIANIFKSEYPEIIESVRVRLMAPHVIKIGETRILETGGISADPSIFNVFSYTFISGDPETALQDPESIVLTESLAKKYFGNENALGQVIRYDNKFDFKVTGIVEDLPENAYRTFTYVLPLEFLKKLGQDIEGTPFFPCQYLTYVLLDAGIDYQDLSDKISQRIFSKGETISFEIVLMPFNDTYMFDTGGETRNLILALIALIILSIACINFMNLATARATVRAREIGVRKVTGASRFEIAKQFIGESLLLTGMAGVLALIIIRLLLNKFNQMTGKAISLDLADPVFWIGFVGLLVIAGLLAGGYPALYLSRFQPVRIFKQQSLSSARGRLRKTLIVVQFVFSIGFVIMAIVISSQVKYVKSFNLGVNESNVIYVQMDGDIQNSYQPLKQELLQDPQITTVTTASNLPNSILNGSFFQWGVNDQKSRRLCYTETGYDFLETFDLELVDGRYFSPEYPNDAKGAVVVNEAAIKAAGMEMKAGVPFFVNDRYITLVGIVKDFHHNKTLTGKPEPLAFGLNTAASKYLFIKINPELKDIREITKTVGFIRETCDRFSPERPLNYQYLSDVSHKFNQTQEFSQKIILLSTILAVFVSCLGLFGLSTFLNEQRTKEIGIRKILGAEVSGIIFKTFIDFGKWVLIANIIAWPVSWFLMNKWLQSYVYRIHLNLWIFLLAGILAFAFAVLTVSWQSVKAANANPVDALRFE